MVEHISHAQGARFNSHFKNSSKHGVKHGKNSSKHGVKGGDRRLKNPWSQSYRWNVKWKHKERLTVEKSSRQKVSRTGRFQGREEKHKWKKLTKANKVKSLLSLFTLKFFLNSLLRSSNFISPLTEWIVSFNKIYFSGVSTSQYLSDSGKKHFSNFHHTTTLEQPMKLIDSMFRKERQREKSPSSTWHTPPQNVPKTTCLDSVLRD